MGSVVTCSTVNVSSSETQAIFLHTSLPPNRSSLMMDSSRYLDHRTPPASSGSHPLATSTVVQSERPYDSAPLDRLTIVHRSGRSFTSTGSNYDLLVRIRLHLMSIGGLHPIIFVKDAPAKLFQELTVNKAE